MINYLKKLMNARSPESSKRFIAIYSFFLFVIVVISALFGIVVPEVYIYSLVSLILGSSVMTLAQNNSLNKSESTSTSKSKTTTKTDDGKETSQ